MRFLKHSLCVVQNPMAGEDNFWISAESILVLNYSDSMTMRFGVDYIVSTTEEDGEGLTLPLMNLAYGEGGCTYVPYGAVDKYGNWVAAADGSVRQMTLPIEESGQERSWYVCGGTDGKAHVLDVGRERLLVIHASGCRRCENSEAETPVLGFKCGCRCEKLVALNAKIEVAAALAGEICRIENGYLTAIEPLGTVLGHEKRTRYEFFGGSLRELPPETGFFTNRAHMPNSPRETALALMQAVRLGREDEADALLSRELAETLSFAELCDFFGSFADERIAPSGLCEPTAYDNSTAEKIIVGAIKTDAGGLVRAEKFVFTIENGVVTDVEGED